MDIVARRANVAIVKNWHVVEVVNGTPFRWVTNDATLHAAVLGPGRHALSIDLEPGPAVDSKVLSVSVLDTNDKLVGTFQASERQVAVVDLSGPFPMVHSLTLHVNSIGKAIAGDPRVLNFRVFSIAVTRATKDIIPTDGSIRLGRNWYPREVHDDEAFRWVNNSAEVELTNGPEARRLVVEVEPGPAIKSKPARFRALDSAGKLLLEHALESRATVEIPLPPSGAKPYKVQLQMDSDGKALPGDTRVLNFRVFSIVLS